MGTAVAIEHSAASSPSGDGRYAGPPRAAMDKATIHVFEPQPQGNKGAYTTGPELFTVQFQFNPKELTFSKAAKWPRQQAKAAKKSASPEFSGAEPTKLSMEMFFDATSDHGSTVVDSVEQLLTCCMPTEKSLSDKKPRPPLVKLAWGSITGFVGFITSVSAKYSLFAQDGTPIRATCSVSMEEMPPPDAKQNPTSGSVDVRGHHRVVAGDTLASLAYQEYNDPTLWRAIADFNGIDDPLRLREGTLLTLPIDFPGGVA